MRRIIIDIKKLTPELLSLLTTKYPHGYDDGHIIKFKDHKDQVIEAVEVRTSEAIYLVKVSSTLEQKMIHFSEADYQDKDYQTPIDELPNPN